jgi:hypothetical protein
MFLCGRRSGSFREDEVEFALLRERQRRRGGGNRGAQRPQNAQPALDSIRSNGMRNGEQIAARLVNLVSFHGGIMKQGVGHRLSKAENNFIIFQGVFVGWKLRERRSNPEAFGVATEDNETSHYSER